MDDYIALIRRLAEEDSDRIIPNSTTEHAIVLIERLFLKAGRIAKIFTGALNSEIYAKDSVVTAISGFLKKGGKLEILVQHCTSSADIEALVKTEGGLFSRLTDLGHRDVDIAMYWSDEAAQNERFHFMVLDEKAFRFEPDHTKHEAFACFNGVKVAKSLNKVFQSLVTMERRYNGPLIVAALEAA